MTGNAPSLDFAALPPEGIRELLATHRLSLTVDEALQIQNRILKRPPTLAEAVLWSIQGSEHCSYKSSRPHLKKFLTDGPNVILGPSEDAGIVEVARDSLGRRYGIALSHESHNHPSQVVPYEGAATGVGGNVRDVCCMGARVVAVGDSLRFGSVKSARARWIADGVVAGIAGYGNPLGIPNVAGDVYFDPGYEDNCLVTVLTLGAVAEEEILHSYAPDVAGDLFFILVGKPTDNSGFGGASFASVELLEEEKELNRGAVQEPNAFLERHLLKATYALVDALRDKGQINRVGFKDLGAGGIACASVELADAAGLGAEIDLENVPTGMQGLLPHVILCSETQERFMWVVPPDLVEMVLQHYNETFALPEVSHGARAAVVGKVRRDGIYRVTCGDQVLVEAPAAEVTRGLVYDRPFERPLQGKKIAGVPAPGDWGKTILQLLAHENIASRKPVFERYDKQVQGTAVVEAGRGDAGVIAPFRDGRWPAEISKVGVAASLDQNPRYNRIDPHAGAAWAVVEAFRNVAAVGAAPACFTDCLCYGNPEKPRQMGEFVAGVEGVAQAAASLHLMDYPEAPVPIVAGNVSLYNESPSGSIPPSPMIGCLGVLPDAAAAVGFSLTRPGAVLLYLGRWPDRLDGSLWAEINALGKSGELPAPDYSAIEREAFFVIESIRNGHVVAAHDVSDGGLAVCLAEMAIVGGLGFRIELPAAADATVALLGEFGGFVVECAKDVEEEVLQRARQAGVTAWTLGEVLQEQKLIYGSLAEISLAEASRQWDEGLREKLF